LKMWYASLDCCMSSSTGIAGDPSRGRPSDGPSSGGTRIAVSGVIAGENGGMFGVSIGVLVLPMGDRIERELSSGPSGRDVSCMVQAYFGLS
jgi:hypothetical protein